MTLLGDVSKAAEKVQAADVQRKEAQEELRARIIVARDEGISFTRIAVAAELSVERIRQLYAGR